MSRWLAAVKKAQGVSDKIDLNDKNDPPRIKSILSILSGGGQALSNEGDPQSFVSLLNEDVQMRF